MTPSRSETPPRTGFLLSQLGTYSTSRFAELVRPLGLTPAAAGVLRLIARSPGLSQRELADRVGAVPSRVVVLVDALERAGLVVRERRPDDRRNYRVQLTDDGRAAMRELRAAAERQTADIVAPLDESERAQFATLLAKLADAHRLDAEVHAGYAHGTSADPPES